MDNQEPSQTQQAIDLHNPDPTVMHCEERSKTISYGIADYSIAARSSPNDSQLVLSFPNAGRNLMNAPTFPNTEPGLLYIGRGLFTRCI